jgi:hypothetical protein
MHLAEIMNERT